MGFLHKLWDETLAGPMPESGLGKLRKYDSFSGSGANTPPRSSSPAAALPQDNMPLVTRSITILRTNSNNLKNISVDPGSAPDSPRTPRTPFSPSTPRTPVGSGGGEFSRFTRRRSSVDAFDRTG